MDGGSQNVAYYLSGSYSKQSAFIKPTDFQRAAMSIQSEISRFSEKFTLENSLPCKYFFSKCAIQSLVTQVLVTPAYAWVL